jgi:ABC-type Fe3+/spermidine/putrescine transport system ATPase subunit
MGVSTFLDGQQEEDKLITPLGVFKVLSKARKSCQSIFAIRPEYIRIEIECGENSLPGKVRDRVFRGEYVEYQVEIENLSVRSRMLMPSPIFPPGEIVQVHFPAQHLFEIQP